MAEQRTYRIGYRIDENTRIVLVLDIDHRSEIYHRPQR
jgi:mRNA-degrading endonuclease RelE of RelBE toxin-antitoxin system